MRRLAFLTSFTLLSFACSTESTTNPAGDDASTGDAGTETSSGGDAVPVDGSQGDGATLGDGAASETSPSTDSSTDSAPPVTATCAATFKACTPAAGTNKFVRLKGTIVTPATVHCDGEVLFSTETGKIACAGDDCSADPEAAAAQVVCSNGVVYPGLIDPHQHADYNHMPVWKHTKKFDNRSAWRADSLYDDFKIPHRPFGSTNQTNQIKAQRYAEIRIAMAGGTSMAGTAGALLGNAGIAAWLRNLDSTDYASYGEPGGYVDPDTDTVLLKGSGGAQIIDTTGTASHVNPIIQRMQAATYKAFLPHIAEGMDALARSEFDEADKLGAITAKTSIIHCTGCSTQQFSKMATVGADLIWSPRSNLDLYGRTAAVTTAKNLGIKIAIGVDWTPSGSMNPIGELQCVAKLNSTYYDNAFNDRDIVEMSTTNAAHAVNMQDQLGQLAPNFWADIMVVDGDRTKPYRALLDAHAAKIRLVTVKGKAIYGDPDVLSGTIVTGETCQAVPDGISPDGKTGVCGTAKSFCVSSFDPAFFTELKTILATAKAADTQCNTASPTGTHCYAYELYSLFRCDTGPELDRCAMGHPAIPRVTSAGGGTIAAVSGTPAAGTDDDGDGVANATDNCPKVFNPPFDIATVQDDADGDGLGDACDPAPCTKDGVNVCVGDADGDGKKDDQDNCPSIANPDQADTDTDGKGNVCDPCPNDANPGTMACPPPVASLFTIPEIRDPASAKRPAFTSLVKVENAIVTAVRTAGTTSHAIVIQDPTATQWAGIYVFLASAAVTVVPGDVVTVQGQFALNRAQEQIVPGTTGVVTKTGTGAVPAPIVVLPADIATGGSKAKLLQSMLVQIVDVTASTAPTLVSGANIWTATPGNLTVTDFIAGAGSYTVMLNDQFATITGIVYAFTPTGATDDSRLAPRTAADVVKK